jgi:hypothetical protein
MTLHLCPTTRFRVLGQQQEHIYCCCYCGRHRSRDTLRTFGHCHCQHFDNNFVETGSPISKSLTGTSFPIVNELPVVSLYDILEAHGSLRRRRSIVSAVDGRESKLRTVCANESVDELTKRSAIRHLLFNALKRHGFILIRVSKGRAVTAIQDLRKSLFTDFFPTTTESTNDVALTTTHIKKNQAKLLSSATTYVSERGIPMYKLGYELCEDNVREVFRIAPGMCSQQDSSVTWPLSSRKLLDNETNDSRVNTESIWTRAVGLLRHTTDAVLDLLLQHQQVTNCDDIGVSNNPEQVQQRRLHSNASSWWNMNKNNVPKQHRPGDYSVLYAMHYFNEGSVVEPGVSVKEHVDPSLLVIEPFTCTTTSGLQIWDRVSNNAWIDCDGPNSPLHQLVLNTLQQREEIMLLFVGKAFSEAVPSIPPTLHRVVTGLHPRRTIIYEQKYSEFYPTPTFD